MKNVLTFFASILIGVIADAQVNLQKGLVAEYTFSGNANDETGHGFNATLHGGATATGTLDLGYDTLDYLTVPSQVLNNVQDFTVGFIVKVSTFNSENPRINNTFISSSESDDLKRFDVGCSAEEFHVWIHGKEFTFTADAKQNDWFPVVIVRKGHFMEVYSNKFGHGGGMCSALKMTIDTIIVGQKEGCPGGCFNLNKCANSQIDNLVFYNRALNTQEIEALLRSSPEDRKQMHLQSLKSFFIYPNPVSNQLNFSFPFSNNIVTITDLFGREMKRTKITSGNSASINIGSLADGVYFVTVRDEFGNYLASQKLLKD